jgi:putative N6-adenine-specific DNA methylase
VKSGSYEKLCRKARRVLADPPRRFLATVQPAFRAELRAELAELGFGGLSGCEGGVEFEAGFADAWRANLFLRTASRIWMRLAAFKAGALEELFRKSARLPWELWLNAQARPDIEAVVERSRVQHEGRTAETILKAVRRRLDEFGLPGGPADFVGQRLLVRVIDDRVELSLDTSGALLHQRGWRLDPGGAPLRETEAAALLRWAGWHGDRPLLDGMCGSGTFVIEAALLALGQPACCGRLAGMQAPESGLAPLRHFAFESQPAFQPRSWAFMLRKALERSATGQAGSVAAPAALAAGGPPQPCGLDLDAAALAAAAGNAGRTGLDGPSMFRQTDFFHFEPSGPPGLLVLNPPYGRRLESPAGLYRRIGRSLAEAFRGWDALVLAADPAAERALGRAPQRRLVFRHGGLKVAALLFSS